VQVNLAYRWFCRLSVEDQIPDHSVFSRARYERFRARSGKSCAEHMISASPQELMGALA